MIMRETIAAIATPPGFGGVGIVRLSGPSAYEIALKISRTDKLIPRMATFRTFFNADDLLDEGIVIYFKAPHSFTGEDVIEFQAHGSPVVLNRILDASIALGARLAKPGEFSLRAFLNNKIDLTQAEAIADLIASSSDHASKLALRSLQGDFSKRVHEVNDAIVHLRMYVEAAIDFPEEEIDFLGDGRVENLLLTIKQNLSQLRREVQQGALLREGGIVVIAGPPNAGKSTLINALAGDDIAIVTDVAGTTRDVMRERILIDDLPIQIVDTAGLRETDDIVEQEGIKRARRMLEQADCVLWVSTAENLNQTEPSLTSFLSVSLPQHVPILKIFNKIDQMNQAPKREEQSLFISAKKNLGLDLLKSAIKETLGYQPSEGIFMARQRHVDALNAADTFLVSGQNALKNQRAGELLADDLYHAHLALCSITGEFTSDDLLGEIFSSFCIGK